MTNNDNLCLNMVLINKMYIGIVEFNLLFFANYYIIIYSFPKIK